MTESSLNVCLIGGAGYIGIELARALCATANINSLTIFDNLQRGNFNVFCGAEFGKETRFSFIEADILDSRQLKLAVADSDVIYNLAAAVPSKQAFTAPHVFEQINNWGTENLVSVVRGWSPRARLIHVSSLGVFGSGSFGTIESPLPNDPYGLSKLRGEGHVVSAREELGLDCAVVRCPSIFGYSKNLRLDSLLNRMVFDANFSGRVIVPGDIEAFSPHCFIDNLVDQLASLVEARLSESILFAKCSNISAQMVVHALEDLLPGLQSTHVDANQYRQQLVFSEDLPFVIPVDEDILRTQLQQFLANFAFKKTNRLDIDVM